MLAGSLYILRKGLIILDSVGIKGNRIKLQIIKMQLRNAEITHPEARLLAKPLIIEINNLIK